MSDIRKSELPHLGKESYLDYTGAGLYSASLIRNYKLEILNSLFLDHEIASDTHTTRNNLTNDIKNDLLSYLGANPNEYSVIFVASATQALKLIGENFPWTSSSTYLYTEYNHNSVLGIRKYAIDANAKFATADWPLNVGDVESFAHTTDQEAFHLFAFPLEDNFAGTKPPYDAFKAISRPDGIRKKNWYVVGDAAAYLPTNKLNLTDTPFDAIVMSFYKIFGFPNTGALVIRNEFLSKLRKRSFTSNSATNAGVHDGAMITSFEDDKVPTEVFVGVRHGLKFMRDLGIDNIHSHVQTLTHRLASRLGELQHSTGQPVIELYGNHFASDPETQGGIVAFNIHRTNGSYFGYSAVVSEAGAAGFHLRGGCHCNPGACFTSMKISETKVREYFSQKTTCGDSNDVIDGVPLGSVRASLGWGSNEEDVDKFIEWIIDNYVF